MEFSSVRHSFNIVMKKYSRFLLGLFSSLCLCCGLVRAAEKFDPLHPQPGVQQPIAATPSCSQCEYFDR
jgi:hypothetical protein